MKTNRFFPFVLGMLMCIPAPNGIAAQTPQRQANLAVRQVATWIVRIECGRKPGGQWQGIVRVDNGKIVSMLPYQLDPNKGDWLKPKEGTWGATTPNILAIRGVFVEIAGTDATVVRATVNNTLLSFTLGDLKQRRKTQILAPPYLKASPESGGQVSAWLLVPREQRLFRTENVVIAVIDGVRYSEAFGDPAGQYTPNLWQYLVPLGTLYTHFYNNGPTSTVPGHAQILTGVPASLPNSAGFRPSWPTIFEYAKHRWFPAVDNDQTIGALVVGKARLADMNYSSYQGEGYGIRYGATLYSPHQLQHFLDERLGTLARGDPLQQFAQAVGLKGEEAVSAFAGENIAPAKTFNTEFLTTISAMLAKSDEDFRKKFTEIGYLTGHWITARDTTTYGTLREVLREKRPAVVLVNFGEVDEMGHTGTWWKYTAAIRGADILIKQLWDDIQGDPLYRDRTMLIVTTDHGRHDIRDGEGDFDEHGGTGESDRHCIFLALGPDIRKGAVISTPASQIDIVPTIGYLMGFETPFAKGRILSEMIAHHANRAIVSKNLSQKRNR